MYIYMHSHHDFCIVVVLVIGLFHCVPNELNKEGSVVESCFHHLFVPAAVHNNRLFIRQQQQRFPTTVLTRPAHSFANTNNQITVLQVKGKKKNEKKRKIMCSQQAAMLFLWQRAKRACSRRAATLLASKTRFQPRPLTIQIRQTKYNTIQHNTV
jgi:hypothetical protein